MPPTKPTPKTTASLRRHHRKCQVCHHPQRDEIDHQFIHWVRPTSIASFYRIEWKALYRHAHALDVLARRRENMRFALDSVIERGAQTPITGDEVIRAVRAQACLTDDGHWIEPVKRVIHIHEHPQLAATSGSPS